MTEAEWLTCDKPEAMLRFLLGTEYPRVQDLESFPDCKSSNRKLRLFACACYHRISHLLPDPRAQEAVKVAEQVVDGLVPVDELQQMEARLLELVGALVERWRASRGAERIALTPMHEALAMGLMVVWSHAQKAAYYASSNAYLAFATIANPGATSHHRAGFFYSSQRAEERVQTDILRCIFDDLFRPATFDPSWLTSTVRGLASTIYSERAFGRLPILADALEEAGCDQPDLLAHCRSDGPHARGCWVVDLILGKS